MKDYPRLQQLLTDPELRADEAHVYIEPFATCDTRWWAHLGFKPGSGRPGAIALGNSVNEALANLEDKIAVSHMVGERSS